ncbi:chaperonin-like RbcX protein 2, chloroplastic isoform X2 [Cryptomeria japonica]|uniref:chaperonin-like RbcX protein 2, chloroplastic isoform X2 n=1 Tax=Cryptomeria japonica TaxID=3369 RepID=UPI0025AC1037|nr:chaperonin-like RbcX protein 2, chloroplastic isoform X2 [Cryptomeria japonica]
MTGALSVLGAIGDRHEVYRSNFITEARLYTFGFGKRQQNKGKSQSVLLGSWNMSERVFRGTCSWRHKKRHSLVVVDEFAGQYEENFADVGKHLLDYFTFKAVKTVLTQLYEMNPTEYRWFYNYVANNKPSDGKRFLRLLVKGYNHVDMHKAITDQNLELMRERLVQTIRWPSDSENDGENNG